MRYLFFIALLFGLMSCDSNQPTTQNPEQSAKKTEPLEESQVCLDITKLRNVKDTNAMAQTNIQEFELKNGCICINYEYSGCTVGEPTFVWDGEVTEENTWPTINMNVHVKNAGMCDQLLQATTCFNISELESLGTQVLVYLNGTDKNFLVNFQEDPLKTD